MFLAGKHEVKGPLGRPKHRWKDSIEMDLLRSGMGGIRWIDQAQDMRQVAGCCGCSDELPGSIKCGEFLD